MRICYDYDSFNSLIIVRSNIDLDTFLKSAGAVGGYAISFFTKVYNCIFKESEDLKQSYNRYYECEYDSFRNYIQKEFELEDEITDEIFHVLDSDDSLTILRWDKLSYGESALPDLIFSDDYSELFTNLFIHPLQVSTEVI